MKKLFLSLLATLSFQLAHAQTCVLRQSDAAEIPLGQFVDATDGVTAETGLTISQADVVLKKCAAGGDCGAMAQKNDASACAHDSLGVYECDLNATDTDTVGTLFIYVNESGALTERLVCQVLDTAPFDADFADAATGRRDANVTQFGGSNGAFASGRPEVNTSHFGGTAGTFASGRPEVNTSHIGGSAISQSSGVANVNVAQVSTDSGAADTLETWLDGTAGPASPLGIARQGTAQSATATTLVLDSSASFADDTAIGMTVVACGSTQGYCQSRSVTDYALTTDTATVDTWTVTPSGTITYYLFATAPGGAGSAPTAAQVADAVWDEATTGHTTSGTFGEQVKTDIDDILTDTGTTLDGRIPAALVGGRMDSNVGAISTDSAAADNAEAFFDGTGYAGTGNTIPTVTSVTNAVNANITQISGDTNAADNLETAFDDTAGPVRWSGIADQGTAQSATGTTLVLRSAAAFANSELVGARILITGGSAGVGQSRQITAYTGASDTATVSAWTTTPTGTITYIVYSDTAAAGGSAPTAAEVADAVWDESTTSHTSSGTFGEQLKTDVDAILAALDTEIAAIKAKTDSLTFTVSGQVDANTESMNAESVCGTGDTGTPWKGCP